MTKAKRLILDGVKDHIVSHIASKNTSRETWEALDLPYEGTSEQRKMYLEQNLWMLQMEKGEHINPFLTRLQEIQDQLAVVGSTPTATTMLRQALNAVAEEWQVFIQIILGKATLPSWEQMWAALPEEELRRDLVKCKLDGSNESGLKNPKEEENANLASKGQQGQQRHKRDVSKVKCFRCGEMGHFAS